MIMYLSTVATLVWYWNKFIIFKTNKPIYYKLYKRTDTYRDNVSVLNWHMFDFL